MLDSRSVSRSDVEMPEMAKRRPYKYGGLWTHDASLACGSHGRGSAPESPKHRRVSTPVMPKVTLTVDISGLGLDVLRGNCGRESLRQPWTTPKAR